MRMKTQIYAAFLFALMGGIAAGQAWGAAADALRVGAAKVEITPTDLTGLTDLWGTPFKGVHDSIYARAIVLENGESSAAIVAVDTVEIGDGTPFVARISSETGIPAANIIVAATHDHSAPMVSLQNADGSHKAGPAGVAYVAHVEDDVLTAVKKAKADLQPARLGVGRGTVDININRDQSTSRGYIMGWNASGPSDKTVWVVKFESTAGQPLALLINYAVHGAVIGPENNLLTGDLPGATARYVEQHYADKIVAVWTSSAAGDQNPMIMSPYSTQPGLARTASDTKDENAGNFEAVDVLGRIQGEEVVRVADGVKAMTSQARIWGAEKIVTCPGQQVLGGGTGEPMNDVKTVDAGPVTFRLGVLMIDKIAFTAVSAEVVTKIYQEVRAQSPYSNTIMITLANGRAGYIPDDSAYEVWTQEAIGSPLKKGCGESTIVNGLLDLLRQY
jgi:neutral ceramidase